jgi:ABC-2 type transport system ATP-binding protein
VAILARGRCVASGTVTELLQEKVARYRVRVGDERAIDVLQAGGFAVERAHDGTYVVQVDAAHSARVTHTLAEAGIYLAELTPIARSLEDVFLELTKP